MLDALTIVEYFQSAPLTEAKRALTLSITIMRGREGGGNGRRRQASTTVPAAPKGPPTENQAKATVAGPAEVAASAPRTRRKRRGAAGTPEVEPPVPVPPPVGPVSTHAPGPGTVAAYGQDAGDPQAPVD